MIIAVTPYIYFKNNCEEALQFYAEALKGEIRGLMRVKDGPAEYQQAGLENKVMHAELKIGEASVLASDSMGNEVKSGDDVSLTVNFDNTDELNEAWKKMTSGGAVTMELQDTFWGARFGTFKDKFGINWMFNCHNKR